MVFRCTRTILVCLVAASFACSVAGAADLTMYFPMEDAASPLVDSVSGVTAEAVDSGQVYLQPGPPGFGNAAGLTTNGAWHLGVDESAALRDLSNDFTVAAWVYIDSTIGAAKPEGAGGINRVLGDDVDWDADGWAWGVFNDGRVRFTKNGIIDADTAGSFVPQDEWTHVAVTVSSVDGLTYYVGGVSVENIANTDPVNPTPGNNGEDDFWGVGRSNNSETQWFPGNLDEVRVYSDLLSPEEIAALAVPEPSSMGLLCLAVVMLLLGRRRAAR